MPNKALGGLSTFNMQHGFVEALIRGFRSGFLLDETYHHLTQCDNLEVWKQMVLIFYF
jgi:V-type H+-transporting ATPase subunit d